jgi:hypothetical protein
LQACYRAFERYDLGGDLIQLMSRLERILDHEPLQKVDVALKAPRSLVQPRGFRAVLYPDDILRPPGIESAFGSDRLQLVRPCPACNVD